MNHAKFPYHILVIDDDPLFGNAICATAKQLKINVDYFADLNDALYSVSLSKYDLIISDCLMPQVDGADVTVYASSLLKKPVLLVSASTSHHMAKEWEKTGAIGFVNKNKGAQGILDICLHNLNKGVSL